MLTVRLFLFQTQPFPFGEKGGNGLLAWMAEGRIAQIVCQASGSNDRADLRQERILKFRLTFQKRFGYIIAEWTADAGDFKAVCKPVVHKNAAR